MTSKVLKGEDYTCDTCKNEAHTATPGAPIPRNYWIAVSETRWSKAYFTTITEDYHFCSDACYATWKADGKEPQPERELPLHEAARVLGRRAGQKNDVQGTASAFLCAAEETSHAYVGYLRILQLVVDDIVRRLVNGKW